MQPNRIIEYGIYIFAFFLSIQTRWIIKAGQLNGGYWEYGTFSLYAVDILLASLLIIWGLSCYKQKEKSNRALKFFKLWALIAGLDLFIFISIFFASDKALALFNYFKFLLGVGFFAWQAQFFKQVS